MSGFLRSLAIGLCGLIYPLIPPLYGVFYDLANAQFFTEGTISTVSNNLYILVSVVMLFTFAVTLIKSIVNPDMLTDSKKGTTGFIKRAGLSLVIIALIPWVFDQMYSIQSQILQNNLIEKVITGYQGDAGSGSIAKKSNAGQVLAAVAISDLLYPNEGATTSSGEKLQQDYNLMISSDISRIDDVGEYINEKYTPEGAEDGEEKYVFEFQPLVAVVTGFVVLYLLILFCMDMGVRLIKLGLLEITAPVSVIAYIYGGGDNLKHWTKEVSTTYLQVFIKIAALSIVVFALQNFDSFMTTIDSDHPWLVTTFTLIGLLTLAHNLPDLVMSLFGVSYKSKGGIKGRLAGMAAVGGIAANAWSKLGGKVKGAATLGATALGTGAALGAGAIGKGLDNKLLGGRVQGTAEKLKNSVTSKVNGISNTNFGQNVGRLGRVASAGMKAGSGVAAVKAVGKAYKDDKVTKYKDSVEKNNRNAQFMSNLGVDADTKSLTGAASPTKARDAYANLMQSISKNNMLNKVQKQKVSDKINADLKKSNLDKLKTNHSNVKDSLKALASEASANGNSRVSDHLTTMMNNFSDGKLSTSDVAKNLDALKMSGLINATSAESIISNLDKINHLAANDTDIANIVKNGKVSGASISAAVSNAENIAVAADASLKAELEICNDTIKQEIENYTTASGIINSKYTAEINKQGVNTQVQQGPIAPSNNSETGTAQQSSSVENSSRKLDSSIPSGYTTTASGIVVPNGSGKKSQNGDSR